MKKFLTASRKQRVQFTKTFAVLLLGIALGFGFWAATAQVATGATLTPTEMIQSKLPAKTTIGSATKQQVLTAVCGAVKKWPQDAAQIVRTAAGARKELAGDIAGTSLTCMNEDKERVSCEMAGRILAAVVAVDPTKTAQFTELVLGIVPECRDTLGRGLGAEAGDGEFGESIQNVNPPPGQGGGGGGGFDPSGNICQVCHNGDKTLNIACAAVQAHLNHGDTAGPCPVTPTQNP